MLVLGITSERVIDGCSIASELYNRREEDFVAAQRDRVDAGIMEDREDVGEFEVESSHGI